MAPPGVASLISIKASAGLTYINPLAGDWHRMGASRACVMAHKRLLFRSEVRERILRGTAQPADAVRITLGRWKRACHGPHRRSLRLRPEPFYLDVAFVAIGLVLSALAVRETTHHGRSDRAAAQLRASGYLSAWSLCGGTLAWMQWIERGMSPWQTPSSS